MFALGAILYELVAGRPAFPGQSTLEVVERVSAGRLDPLPGAPSWLVALVTRALDVDPARRYPDAAAFASALRARGGGPRRWPWGLLAAGTVACGLAAVALGPRRAPKPPLPAPAPPPPEVPGIAQGQGLAVRGVLGSFDHRLRKPPRALAVSADGRRAAALEGPLVRVFALPGGEPLAALRPGVAEATAIALSRDGSSLLVGGRDAALVIDASTGAPGFQHPLPAPATCLTWSRSGSSVAIGCADGVVHYASLSVDPPRLQYRHLPPAVRAIVPDPAGPGYLIGLESGVLLRAPREGPTTRLLASDVPVRSAATSPGGSRVAAGLADGTCHAIDLRTGAVEYVARGKGAACSVAFAGEDRLVVAFEESGLALHDVVARAPVVYFDLEPGDGPRAVAAFTGPADAGEHAIAITRGEPALVLAVLDGARSRLSLPGRSGHVGPVACLAVAGDELVSGGLDAVRTWRRGAHVAARAMAGPGPILVAASGRRLHAAQGRRLVRLDADATAELDAPVVDLDATADGVLAASGDRVHVYDPDLRARRSSAPLGAPLTAARAAGDGVLALAGSRLLLLDRALATARALEVTAAPRAAVALARGRLALGGADGRVRIVRLDGLALEETLAAHPAPVTACAWAGDGRLATASEDGEVAVFLERALRGSLSLARSGDAAECLLWDGEDLVVGTGRGAILRVR